VNELYFLSQILIILLFSFGALRLGKEALITSMSLLAILANFFVLKQISFFGFEVTCSDAYTVGSVLSLNLLREYYGKDSAKKAISICFFFMAFFVIMSHLHLRFIPSIHDTTQFAYSRLLTPAPRILIASLLTFYLVQQFDLRAFGLISRILPKSPFPIRSTISLTLSQFIDTILFSFMGLYGMVNSISHIIFVSFLIKVCVIITLGPLTTLFYRLKPRV